MWMNVTAGESSAGNESAAKERIKKREGDAGLFLSGRGAALRCSDGAPHPLPFSDQEGI